MVAGCRLGPCAAARGVLGRDMLWDVSRCDRTGLDWTGMVLAELIVGVWARLIIGVWARLRDRWQMQGQGP